MVAAPVSNSTAGQSLRLGQVNYLLNEFSVMFWVRIVFSKSLVLDEIRQRIQFKHKLYRS